MKTRNFTIKLIGPLPGILFFMLFLATAHTPAFAQTPPTSGKYYIIDYPANTDGLATPVTYTLWVPDGVKKIRAIIVHQHGAGIEAATEGQTSAYDLQWQALAKKWDCALLGPSYHVVNNAVDLTPGGAEVWFDARLGSEKTFLRSLNEFAVQAKHPEIAKVPWALWGHSGGGIWADLIATMHPDRVVAIWLRSGSSYMFRGRAQFPQPTVPDAVYTIPYMSNPGIQELQRAPYIGTLATFKEYRVKGAPIGFAPDPLTGHWTGDSRYLAIPWMDACLAMRLPDVNSTSQKLKPVNVTKGWLAVPEKQEAAVPFAQYKGNVNEAVWLPNQAVAKAWLEYVKTGAVGDVTPPSAPFSVKVSHSGSGNTIVWNAEADMESNIKQFIVLRDGKEIGRVADEPFNKFGRPIFRSMTYHDTPVYPLMPMLYTDATAKTGQQHSYTVIAINGVGLQSKPSLPGK